MNFTQYWLDCYADDVIIDVDFLAYVSGLTQLEKIAIKLSRVFL